MGDVERITTTELRERLLDAMTQATYFSSHLSVRGDENAKLNAIEPLIRADERVRVVEGLVATIKALPDVNPPEIAGYFPSAKWTAAVLAVVEAAREDTP